MEENNIPAQFLSDETGEPFTHCVMCNCNLMESNKPYAIEKALKRMTDGSILTLFEMAICMDCGQEMHEKLSASSKKVMEEYFMRLELPQKRMQSALNNAWESSWNDKCLVTGEPLIQFSEFNVMGNFIGNKVIPKLPPMSISAEVLELVQEKLSPESKEELDGFRDRFLGPSDPELRELLSNRKMILI